MTIADRETSQYMTFAQNLRHLMQGKYTVSELSRKLGLHRNQLQRYVDGESAPKPRILKRICRLFDVDARILTEDLNTLEPNLTGDVPAFLYRAIVPAPHTLMPDGTYETWQDLTGEQAHFVKGALTVYSRAGMRYLKAQRWALNDTATPGAVRSDGHEIHEGLVLAQNGGVCLLSRHRESGLLSFTALTVHEFATTTLFAGQRNSMQSVLTKITAERSSTVLRRVAADDHGTTPMGPEIIASADAPDPIRWLMRSQSEMEHFA